MTGSCPVSVYSYSFCLCSCSCPWSCSRSSSFSCPVSPAPHPAPLSSYSTTTHDTPPRFSPLLHFCSRRRHRDVHQASDSSAGLRQAGQRRLLPQGGRPRPLCGVLVRSLLPLHLHLNLRIFIFLPLFVSLTGSSFLLLLSLLCSCSLALRCMLLLPSHSSSFSLLFSVTFSLILYLSPSHSLTHMLAWLREAGQSRQPALVAPALCLT